MSDVQRLQDSSEFARASGPLGLMRRTSVQKIRAMHRTLGIDRSVLVQPSFYGSDNACLLSALQQLGTNARGVAVVPESASKQQLDSLHVSGIRGIRINRAGSARDRNELPAVVEAAGRQAAERNWHVQLFLPMPVIAEIAPIIEASPAPFVLDHFAGARASGTTQPGFERVLRLIERGHAYLKLTAPYHASQPPDYPGMGELAAAFIDANPERVLWGTDWPHTPWVSGQSVDTISPFYPADNVRLLELLFEWVPEESTRSAILVDNPARLFGFS